MALQAKVPAIDFERLELLLGNAKDDRALFQTIVDSPFEQRVESALMFLGIIVFLLVNEKTKTIDRIALSRTDFAERTQAVSTVPFKEIKIPLKSTDNVIAKAVQSGVPQETTDWRLLFHPALTAEHARINQVNAGIAYSAVYPLRARNGGALIYSYFQYRQHISDTQIAFMENYSRLVDERLAR